MGSIAVAVAEVRSTRMRITLEGSSLRWGVVSSDGFADIFALDVCCAFAWGGVLVTGCAGFGCCAGGVPMVIVPVVAAAGALGLAGDVVLSESLWSMSEAPGVA